METSKNQTGKGGIGMDGLNLFFCWLQVIISALIAIFLVCVLVNNILNHSHFFYTFGFSTLIGLGVTMFLLPSIKELRKVARTKANGLTR